MTPWRKRHAVRTFAGAAVLAVVAVLVSASAQAAGHGGSRHTLQGSKPSWTAAVPQAATAAATTPLTHAKVWLAPRNGAELDALAQAVSDPSNSQYGQFITADQYQAQYAPTQDQVDQVTQWLTQAGLSVDSVGPDNHYVAVSGSTDAINTAFGTRLAQFVVQGQVTSAPTTDLSVPDSLSDVVAAVTGLTKFGHQLKPADFGAPAAFVNATPCSRYYGQVQATNVPQFQGQTLPYAVCGYTPRQLRAAYGVGNGGIFDQAAGRRQTVAITDAYDATTLEQDADVYAVRHGDRPFHGRQFRDLSVPEDATTGDDCGGNGWYGEQALDIEAVHGMAPAANVEYYGAASCFDDDLLASLSRVVADNSASIVTNSWGEPTFVVIDGVTYAVIDQTLVDAYESVFKQGAVQGIGFYFSSGDAGDDLAAFGVKHPEYPSGDPWVTSVGGTSLAVGRNGDRLFETGWGTDKYTLSTDGTGWTPIDPTDPFLYGAGGGFSQIFREPWYQLGTVSPAVSGGGRAVPDIGMDADPTTGMLVGETQDFPLDSRYGPAGVHYGEYRIGGTSLASPLMAGAQAVAQGNAGRRTGFANPLIYFLARNPNMFNDITPQGDVGNVRADFANTINGDDGLVYSVRTFDQDSSLTTGPGWDDVTGVGSVTSRYLNALPSFRH